MTSGLATSAVVEILGRDEQGVRHFGSGYRIANEIILTAAHLVGPEPEWQQARAADGATASAREVCRIPDVDIAFLHVVGLPDLQEPAPTQLSSLMPEVRRVDFVAIGFPRFATRADGIRDSKMISGTIALASYTRSGLLDLHISSVAPRDGDDDPWRGFSGAALFAEGAVVGVFSRRLPTAGTSSADGAALREVTSSAEVASFLRRHQLPEIRSGRGAEPPAQAHVPRILSHDQVFAGLAGIRRNLANDRLPFVDPGRTPSAPAELLDRLLDGSADRGVVLVGAAGAGKTRTCFEVSSLASAAGWRALHVQPGEPLVSTDDVAAAMFSSRQPVLLIIDYLNECRGIDLTDMRRRVLPEARRRGVAVALLATARPGWLLSRGAEQVLQLFDRVDLRVDLSHGQAVCHQMMRSISPVALEALGNDTLLPLCGTRPVIALLIAAEIERRTLEGTLPTELTGLRHGDLLQWLERRLSDDDLLPPRPSSLLEVVSPSPEILLAASIAASAPQQESALLAAVRATEKALTVVDGTAARVFAVLTLMGWLDASGDEVVVVHDVVTDQLLERVLLTAGDQVETNSTEVVLAPATSDARSFGRLATNLGRLIRDQELEDRHRPLQVFLERWFLDRCESLQEATLVDPDVGGYALGAVLSGPPWSNVALTEWDRLLGPWLSQHGDTPTARHLLYMGLRASEIADTDVIKDAGVRWLSLHGDRHDASFVLSGLVRVALPQALPWAVSWLARYRKHPEASFVLSELLRHENLFGREHEVVSLALQWLERFAGSDNSSRILLVDLLHRSDLGDMIDRALHVAERWLDRNEVDRAWTGVLRAALAQPASAATREGVLGRGISWTESNFDDSTAPWVLHCLLTQKDLAQYREEVGRLAAAWFCANPDSYQADRVVAAYLEQGLQVPEEMRDLLDRWTPELENAEDIVYVSKALLRHELASVSVCRALLVWIRHDPTTVDAVWRLADISKRLNKDQYSEIWSDFLDCVENMILLDLPATNSCGQTDMIVINIAQKFLTGYWAARADDVIAAWISSAQSLSGEIAGLLENVTVVSRVRSLFVSGRLDPELWPRTAARLGDWVADWHRDEGLYRREALCLLAERPHRDLAG